jgi:hypothetical protein
VAEPVHPIQRRQFDGFVAFHDCRWMTLALCRIWVPWPNSRVSRRSASTHDCFSLVGPGRDPWLRSLGRIQLFRARAVPAILPAIERIATYREPYACRCSNTSESPPSYLREYLVVVFHRFILSKSGAFRKVGAIEQVRTWPQVDSGHYNHKRRNRYTLRISSGCSAKS